MSFVNPTPDSELDAERAERRKAGGCKPDAPVTSKNKLDPVGTLEDVRRRVEEYEARVTSGDVEHNSLSRDRAFLLSCLPVETTDNSEVELLRAALLQCYSYYPDGPLHRGWIYELVPNDEAACERAEKIMRAKSPGEPRETPAPQNMHSDEWWQAELDRCVGVEQDKYRALFATLRPPSSPEEPTTELPASTADQASTQRVGSAVAGGGSEPPRCICGRGKYYHPWRFCDAYKPENGKGDA